MDLTTDEDTPYHGKFFQNDGDTAPGEFTCAHSFDQPSNGVLAGHLSSGDFTYTPNENFHGDDTFVFKLTNLCPGNPGVTEANAQITTVTKTITVTPINDPPVANDFSVTTYKSTAVDGDVLLHASDVDGDELTIDSFSEPNGDIGTFWIEENGRFRFTPATGFSGSTTVTYTVSDGNGEEATGTITLVVDPKSFICSSSWNPRDTWVNQRDAAMARNGDLLTIQNQEMQTYLQNNFGHEEYFIGLTDIEEQGFKWVDGDTSTYRNWNARALGRLSPYRVYCAVISEAWEWDTLRCSGSYRHALVQFPWSQYEDIVCNRNGGYICNPGPGNTFAHEVCPGGERTFLPEESAGADNSDSNKLSRESIIAGSVAIVVIMLLSLAAVVYLGRKNEWSCWKKMVNSPQTAQEGENDEKEPETTTSSTQHEEKEVSGIENC